MTTYSVNLNQNSSTIYDLDGSDQLVVAGLLQSSGNSVTGSNNNVTVTGGVVASTAQGFSVSSGTDNVFRISETGYIFQTNGSNSGTAIFWSGGSDSAIINDGEISGAWGVYLTSGASDIRIQNSGRISSYTDFTTEGAAITSFATGTHIANTGTLLGNTYAVYIIAGDTLMNNAGEVTGDIGIQIDADAVLDLTNTGTITGTEGPAIRNSGGDVTILNSGEIHGNVALGAGAQTYLGARGGFVEGKVLGQNGNDILRGARDEDDFDGGGGNDVLRGRRGEDILKGGNGLDLIVGGKDDDRMTGGGGADTFVFGRTSADDVITDFQNNIDVLDLSALDAVSRNQLVNKGAIKGDGSGGSVIHLDKIGGQGTIAVDDMSVSDWTNADFIF